MRLEVYGNIGRLLLFLDSPDQSISLDSHTLHVGDSTLDLKQLNCVIDLSAPKTKVEDCTLSLTITKESKQELIEEHLMLDDSCPMPSELISGDLLCRCCSHSVASGITKAFPLPSSNWAEYQELWICHPLPDSDPMSDRPFGIAPGQPIVGGPGILLVGTDHVEVDVSNCSTLEGGKCPECKTDIGEPARINKCSLGGVFSRYTPVTCMVEHLVNLVKTANTFSFLLESDAGDWYLQLKLSDWTVKVWENHESASPYLAVKVMYKVFKSKPESTAHSIVYPQDTINTLRRSLRTSHKSIPEYARVLNGQRVAFLPRISIH